MKREMNGYRKGLHILCDGSSPVTQELSSSEGLRKVWDELIHTLGLTKVGEVYHDFPGGGFTATVCLTESHLSIHTWPEFGYFTLDVYLSNFTRENDALVEAIAERSLLFLQSENPRVTRLYR